MEGSRNILSLPSTSLIAYKKAMDAENMKPPEERSNLVYTYEDIDFDELECISNKGNIYDYLTGNIYYCCKLTGRSKSTDKLFIFRSALTARN